MVSKSISRARTLLAMLLLAACSVPWGREQATEVNLAVIFENNLLYLPSATIDNRRGRYFFGSAQVNSVIDPRVADALGRKRTYALQLGEREALRITPAVLDLSTAGDALIGADAWRRRAVTIDYRSGLLTYQKEGIHPELMTLYRFRGEPSIDVIIDGRTTRAVVDTASPDTMILPARSEGRRAARVVIAGVDFGPTDVKLANVSQPRVGNRLLSKFLLTIDYGRQQVGLWRDPRIPL